MDSKPGNKTTRNRRQSRKANAVEAAPEVVQVDVEEISTALKQAAQDIQILRAQNQVLQGQLDIVNVFKALILPGSRVGGAHPDSLEEIGKLLSKLEES